LSLRPQQFIFSPVPKLLVIADDLTGATDVAGQFAKAGVPTLIPLGGSAFERIESRFEVVCISSESRHRTPSDAARRVHEIARAAAQMGFEYIYKKTDSTLRGNIGSELQSLLLAVGQDRIAFVPAFPRMGRTTRDGFHFVHGQPLHLTPFAQDPLSPMRENYIPAVLARQTTLPIHCVPLEVIRQRHVGMDQPGIHVFDAEQESDLY
jgi:uncharacterized protein YgbK (DUF1537 family)